MTYRERRFVLGKGQVRNQGLFLSNPRERTGVSSLRCNLSRQVGVTRLLPGRELVSQVLRRQIGMEECKIVGRRILVVEDESSVRKSITLLLQIDRHVVTEATNGREALDLVIRQPFDLVVLDFSMPDLLGGEVAIQIKCVAPALPILMVTAYLEKLNDSDKPVDAILGKPFALDELRRAIAKLVPRETAADLSCGSSPCRGGRG